MALSSETKNRRPAAETPQSRRDHLYPPGPKDRFPGETFLAFRRDPLRVLTASVAEYGNLVHFKVAGQHIFLLNEPELIRDLLVTDNKTFIKSRGLAVARRVLGNGLLTSEGEFHLRQRRMIQPAFHRLRIASYAGTMVDYAARTRERWADGATVDMHGEMMRLTLAVVGKTLFDEDVEGEAREIGAALTVTINMFQRQLNPWWDWLMRLPLPSTRRYEAARARLDRTIYRFIRERRASGEDRGDLLSMLLQTQDEEGNRERMTEKQVRDEAMTLFLAGHETTANALTWTWYLLSQNPEAEARMHAEIDAVLGGRLPTVEDLPDLKYTEMALTESMRLYPPAWIVGRQALNDYQLGDGEYVAPEGSTLFASQYIMHRDARFFPEPERFQPERWTPERKASLPKFAYFPFGGGPRVCIGEPFAWMEGVLLLATLGQKWRMRLDPNQRVALLPQITLRPKYGMKMRLERRA